MVPPSLPPLSSAYGSSYSDRMLSSLSTSPLLTLSAYAPWFIGKYSITNALGFSDASPQPPRPAQPHPALSTESLLARRQRHHGQRAGPLRARGGHLFGRRWRQRVTVRRAQVQY